MAINDVTVKIALERVVGITGFGKPVILARKEGASTYKDYFAVEDVATDFGADTPAHKLAATLFNQGAYATAEVAVITYDPTATAPIAATTAAQALEAHFSEDFYFVVADTQVVEEVKAIAAVLEAADKKIFGTTATTREDARTIVEENYRRTFVFMHETVGEYPAEALIGAVGQREVGSVTYHAKQLYGITAQSLSNAEVKQLEADGINVAVKKLGVTASSNGVLTSLDHIDVIQGMDWVTNEIETNVQRMFMNNGKIPFESDGLDMVYAEIKNALAAAQARRIIAEGYTITVPKRAQVPVMDRANRVLKGVTFKAQVTGAVQSIDINGTVGY